MAGDPPINSLVVPGGVYDIEGFLVGQERELRVDTSNESLRLHDGVKEGGYEFQNRDVQDARYQARNPELDGFNFGAQQKGLLVRVGPSTYRIRQLLSSLADLSITNPRGTVGDIDLNLSATIGTDHTWDGIQTFTQRIVALDGLTGDTYGTHYGDVVGGNLSGTFTGTFNGVFGGSFVGNVDVRGFTFLTDPGQITEDQIDPEAWIRRGVPLGAILMWSGSVDTIPESWVLCDGSNGTPDLRNRFIQGAGTGTGIATPGATGGSTSAGSGGTIAPSGAHTHTINIDGHALTTGEMPAHSHGDGIVNGDSSTFNHGTIVAVPDPPQHVMQQDGSTAGVEGNTTTEGGGATHTHGASIPESGEHTHDLTLDAVSILPPYYALCYIMKNV